jgi:hypothetical protein
VGWYFEAGADAVLAALARPSLLGRTPLLERFTVLLSFHPPNRWPSLSMR